MSRWFRVLAAIGCLVFLAGCQTTVTPTPATSDQAQTQVVNPSPLAHLTYQCSVLDTAVSEDLTGIFYLTPYDGPGKPMCALDWDGHLQRELPWDLAERQSPDGSRLLVFDYPISSAFNGQNEPFIALTSSGTVLERYTTIWNREAMWADDSRHLCYIRDSVREDLPVGQGLLTEDVPGGQSRTISTVGPITRNVSPPLSGSQPGPAPIPDVVSGPHLVACSVQADRAVILDEVNGILKVLRLSDGTVVSSHAYSRRFRSPTDPKDGIWLVGSRDGRYVAEQFQADGTAAAHPVTIRDLLTGQVVATFMSAQVAAFSWDGSRVFMERNGNSAVIDWRTNTLIRQLAGFPSGAFPRPDSQDMVACVPSTRHAFGCDLYIVRGNRDAFEVARSVEVPFGL